MPTTTVNPKNRKKHARVRGYANLSPIAAYRLCQAKEAIFKLDLPWDVTDSTVIEFLVARAMDPNFSLLDWRPETRARRRLSPRDPSKKTNCMLRPRSGNRQANLDLMKAWKEHFKQVKETQRECAKNARRAFDEKYGTGK